MNETKSILIKDTTMEEREQIVNDSLGITVGCEDVPQSMIDMYQPYIDGRVELKDISMGYRANYVSGREVPEREGCIFGRG